MNDAPAVSDDDFNALLELLDAATMCEVVQLFVSSAPTRFESARSGVASTDGARVATAFHTLRSGCGQLGARRLETMCAHGEREAKHGDLTAAASLLADAEREFARCREWFAAGGWLDG